MAEEPQDTQIERNSFINKSKIYIYASQTPKRYRHTQIPEQKKLVLSHHLKNEEELTGGFYFAQMPSLYIVQPPPLSTDKNTQETNYQRKMQREQPWRPTT